MSETKTLLGGLPRLGQNPLRELAAEPSPVSAPPDLPTFGPEPGSEEPAAEPAADAQEGVEASEESRGGPPLPDLLAQALDQSHLPDLVTVRPTEGGRTVEPAAVPSAGPPAPVAGVASGEGSGGDRSAEIGPFIGASAKRRRRFGR